MTNKPTPTEVAKVMAMYLGCECTTKEIENGQLEAVNILEDNCFVMSKNEDEDSGFYGEYGSEQFNLNEVQLLLTNIANITDADAIEVAKAIGHNAGHYKEQHRKEMMVSYGKSFIQKIQSFRISSAVENYFGIQQLITLGYAVPLYFGVDHPNNGKDAIELGIAIDKNKINQ